MQTLLIKNATVYADGHAMNRWVLCEDGRITAVGRDEPDEPADATVIDADDMALLPGFVDIHVHGGNGVDAMDATPEATASMAAYFARHGVTSFLTTTWTDAGAQITAALENAVECVGPYDNGATLRGVHLEGPYLNPKRSGAQNSTYVRRADRAEATRWLDMGVIRVLSLAPEYEENHWLIHECVERGIRVSAAHTDASYEEIVQAVSMGLTNLTHTFNAMTGLHHRRPGVAGAAMSVRLLVCELIADNIHVHPAVMRLLWNAKNYQNVALITDSIRAGGMPDGDYPVDERTLYVRNGVAQLEDGTLAGSTLTMDAALRNFMAATGSDLDMVYEASSTTPAEAAGLSDVTGSIAPGKDADMVLLDADLNVKMTIAQGRIVYEA
ncbi:MAG: N-acetylglucosamine-6-phosphate deacetylase [Chloroflexota bacterium]